jgi:hypothetical protein
MQSPQGEVLTFPKPSDAEQRSPISQPCTLSTIRVPAKNSPGDRSACHLLLCLCSQQAAELLRKLTDDRTWQSQPPHYGTKAARDLLDAAQRHMPVSLPSVSLPSFTADSLQLPAFSAPSVQLPKVELPQLGSAEKGLQDAAVRISQASICKPPLPTLLHCSAEMHWHNCVAPTSPTSAAEH